jgi:8-oxo-dGTP pyrophosphatase MutT (NUDIX family)
MRDFEQELRSALALDLPYMERPPDLKAQSTPASVLLLFGETSSTETGEPELLMTRRTETVEKHKGQMAFPGGAGDSEEDSIQTALRETHEEVGISPDHVTVLGALPPLWTPTGFWITPVVGLLKTHIDETRLSSSVEEIAEAFWIPLSTLQKTDVYSREFIERGQIQYVTHVYQVGPYRIWGATGAMIKNLLDRLAAFE